jgi:hypothetical protein
VGCVGVGGMGGEGEGGDYLGCLVSKVLLCDGSVDVKGCRRVRNQPSQ